MLSNYPPGWSSRDECMSGICGGCDNCKDLEFDPDAAYDAWRDEQILWGEFGDETD